MKFSNKYITRTLLVLLCLSATACDNEPETLISPCVGAEGSPCDNRTPINLNHLDAYKAKV